MTGTALALAPDQTAFSDQQLKALEQFGIINVPPAELEVFFHHSKRCGLDPFLKQIYLIERYNSKLKRKVWTPQTSIDGLRLIADRTGKYVGSESSTHYVGGKLISATVTVRKVVAGLVGEFTATAKFSEYVQRYQNGDITEMWQTKGETMLTKCAEAKALRMAFPQDMFGVYTEEEMMQADNVAPVIAEAIEVDSLVSSENIERFKERCLKAGFAWEKIFEAAEAQVEGLRESQLPTLAEAFKLAQVTPAEFAIDEVETPPADKVVAETPPATKEPTKQSVKAEAPKPVNPDVEILGRAPISDGQIRVLGALCRGKGWDDAKRHKIASTFTGRIIESFKELSIVEASRFIDYVKGLNDGA